MGHQDDGTPFVVMDYVAGTSLVQILASNRSPVLAADLVAHVAETLDYVHAQGLVHRDLKPDNLILDSRRPAPHRGSGLVLDENVRWQHRREFAGTVYYMAAGTSSR